VLSKVGLRVELDRRVNFAAQQNDVPVIKGLHVDNHAESSLTDITLRISAEPAFAERWEARIASIPTGSSYQVPAVDLVLAPQFLGELTERIRGQLRFELMQGEQLLLDHIEALDLLARDEWGGLSSLPEILAAFALPNHPAVEEILKDAAGILRGWTGDPSLSGYQSKDRRRVVMIAAAIYGALQKQNLTYINPPASFETEGQRVRLPDRILEARMGTCLDLTMLATACLEQAGLHPIVVLVKGHAFAGVWLQDEYFGDLVIDDPLRIRKRIELNEIAAFDPTCVTAQPSLTFDQAGREAWRRFEDPQEFLCAIDVARARKGKIRPLPERVAAGRPGREPETSQDSTEDPAPPDVEGISTARRAAVGTPAPQTPSTRLDLWQRRLLDLSLRNRLLNCRDTKKSIPLLCPDLAELEDVLSDRTALEILPRPRDLTAGGPRDADLHRRRTGDDPLEMLLREELHARRLYADLAKEELDRRLLEVYRAARLGLEEGGASALYLALGFLGWYETPESSQRRLAPILLFPLELRRRSVREGFSLVLSDDEPRVNVTLLQLLQQDHGVSIVGLDQCAEDAKGFDVGRTIRAFREAVRDIDRWEVLEVAQLGLFSFTKFLMWRDLVERTADLVKNPVVDHLINHPGEPFGVGDILTESGQIVDEKSPLQTFCPMPADSSQLAAVFAAAGGRSFVLEGPPGTGKSQTITNLIAHCLAEGRTVLFVSEKMAALSVVRDRLQRSGLGRYCLELHSNKANKREVVEQLDQARQAVERKPQGEWEREARRLEGLRNELNAYVLALHKPRGTGESVFQATSQLIGLRDVRPVSLRWESPDAFTPDGLSDLRDLVDRVATAGHALGNVRDHPWAAVGSQTWTPGWEAETRVHIERLNAAINTLSQHLEAVSPELCLGERGWSLEEVLLVDEVAGVLLESPHPQAAVLSAESWEDTEAKILGWMDQVARRDALRAPLLEEFSESLLELDLDALAAELRRADESWWPASYFRRRRVVRALASTARDRKLLKGEEIPSALKRAIALRSEAQTLSEIDAEARELLGRHWRGGKPQREEVSALCDWVARFRSLIRDGAGSNLERALQRREKWTRLVTEGADIVGREGPLGKQLVACRQAVLAFREARAAVEHALELDSERAWGGADNPDVLGCARRTVFAWIEDAARLREWCAWRRARSEGIAAGLKPLVEAYERGEFASEEIRRVFERSYYQWWHGVVVDSEPVLAQFFSPEHERRIAQFREVDSRYLDLTREVIAARLAEKIPGASASVLAGSEMGILLREIGKKRRHLPIRQLVRSMPNLLPLLKPCLLMSPVSVAQFLDSSHSQFDLVVFDEASQIPVWDAIGAIARGRQAIIVGDPKQLPPTNFFQRAEDVGDDASESEVVEDLESILDDCIGAGIPSLQLNWHYRSQHESLIAFSNYHYYENRLLTFPSPHLRDMGVVWRHVPGGVYDKGKSRTNHAEAVAVVEEVRRRLKDPKLAAYSIGIVTFSLPQQTLIEDLLEVARQEDQSLDAFFSEEVPQPIFVKNLESVQGDERDVILFSIGYGPDAQGRVSMNFGPMNRDGGERRLNVAVTRARREVLVFSTLRPEQIDLARTRARGVSDLKNFLEYAERGPRALAAATHYDPAAEFESPFEKDVCNALAGKGWTVHPQVGCSGYRVDLGVIDPDAPGRYLLGIECDGANYHRARSARDRDKLREGVLRDLGWEIHRIWSTDWWLNPKQEIQKVEAALASAKAKEKGRAVERVPEKVTAPVPRIELFASTSAPVQPPQAPAPSAAPSTTHPVYKIFPYAGRLGSIEDFYEPRSRDQIQRLLVDVVLAEGPISLDLLARRVAAHWEMERITSRALRRIRRLLPTDKLRIYQSKGAEFVWSTAMDPWQYGEFRVPGADPAAIREAGDLPFQEVANGMLFILRQNLSAPRSDLIRETSRLFGFQRTGRLLEERMSAGVDLLVESGRASEANGVVTLTRAK